MLTKSEYMMFLKHPAWLWLKKYQKHMLPPIDENTQAQFDTGHEFETYAEQLFPGALKLGFSNYAEYCSLPQKTENALEEAATIVQGRFEVNNLTCIVDVLTKIDEKSYKLVEIKSSTKVKLEHQYDLAFQVYVLEQYGLKIDAISVMHVNNEYVRKGKIDPKQLITETDVTSDVKDLLDITEKKVAEAFKVLEDHDMPDLSPRYANSMNIPGTTWFTDWMTVYEHLNPDLDKYSIYNLAFPNQSQLGKLEDMGITLIPDIPEELALRPKQVAQIHTTRTETRIIDETKIKEFLNSFAYPIYFFDYETLSSIIPPFDGMSPYKDYPFQYSLHILDSPNSALRHTEYLHQENSNPMPELLEKLKMTVGDIGTILTWNMAYEKACNDRMAEMYPQYEKFLSDFNERIVDLMTPFSEMWFVDKDFFGSASIKTVLPVLVPALSHKELDVSDGLKARRMWTETILEGKNQDNKQKIVADLLKYCTLDTFAMVEIYNFLSRQYNALDMVG